MEERGKERAREREIKKQGKREREREKERDAPVGTVRRIKSCSQGQESRRERGRNKDGERRIFRKRGSSRERCSHLRCDWD